MKFKQYQLWQGKWYITFLGGEDQWLEMGAKIEDINVDRLNFNPWFETGEFLTDPEDRYIVVFRFPFGFPADYDRFMEPIKKYGDEECIRFFDFILKYLKSRGFKDTYAIIDPKDFSVEELRPYWWD